MKEMICLECRAVENKDAEICDGHIEKGLPMPE